MFLIKHYSNFPETMSNILVPLIFYAWKEVIRMYAIVTRHRDGDTFEVDRAVSGYYAVRLAGVDAPEQGERGYYEATRELARLAPVGSMVSVEPAGRISFDRIVAYVTCNGVNVNQAMKTYCDRNGY